MRQSGRHQSAARAPPSTVDAVTGVLVTRNP